MRAVVDRIVDGTQIVLLVGEEEVEMILLKEQLSIDVKEGTILDVNFVNGQLQGVKFMEDSTHNRIADQVKQLRKRQRSKYKRNG